MTTRDIEEKELKITKLIDALVEILQNKDNLLQDYQYNYQTSNVYLLLIHLYFYKLAVTDKELLKTKYNKYKNKFISKKEINLSKITNIKAENELDLLLKIKEKSFDYSYNHNGAIVFIDNSWIDSKWLLPFLCMILEDKKESQKEINICYAFPSRDIEKLTSKDDELFFLSHFTYYNIKVKHIDKTKPVQDNTIVLLKNAAINYLKHLKQYHHGLEPKESYLTFYNVLKNECSKQGFELIEQKMNLIKADESVLNITKEHIDPLFINKSLSKQISIIENIIWKSSNSITLLDYVGESITNLINFISLLKLESKKQTYRELSNRRQIQEINILLMLIINRYIITYLDNDEDIDYSVLDLKGLNPKYMNYLSNGDEQDIKNQIKAYDTEIIGIKNEIETYKEQRSTLDKEKLGDKFLSELERCVSNINRLSILIGRINSKTAELNRQLEDIKKNKKEKYRNIDTYYYNNSIIRHICNSIITCNFYLKTNNKTKLMDNIVVFEDYDNTTKTFYLEITFKELLRLSKQYSITDILEQIELPKLSE